MPALALRGQKPSGLRRDSFKRERAVRSPDDISKNGREKGWGLGLGFGRVELGWGGCGEEAEAEANGSRNRNTSLEAHTGARYVPFSSPQNQG